MRITIEPTEVNPAHLSSECLNHKVVVEHPRDDLGFYTALELIASALKAYGYSSQTVDCIFNEDYD